MGFLHVFKCSATDAQYYPIGKRKISRKSTNFQDTKIVGNSWLLRLPEVPEIPDYHDFLTSIVETRMGITLLIIFSNVGYPPKCSLILTSLSSCVTNIYFSTCNLFCKNLKPYVAGRTPQDSDVQSAFSFDWVYRWCSFYYSCNSIRNIRHDCCCSPSFCF